MKNFIKRFIPGFLLDYYHYILALLGAFIYGFPAKNKKIKIIGITGTSGKTTTVDLVSRIFEEAGYKIASFSTVRFKIGNREWKNELKMTMPGRFKIQKFLRQAINERCEFAVLEVSSEGIRQNRHRFINFDAAVFTNLSFEHIESHGGFEKYRNEKIKLFKEAKNMHIVNADDKNSGYFLGVPARKKIGFNLAEVENIRIKPDGISFDFKGTNFNLNLQGEFNVYNSLCAITIARAYGVSLKTCKTALEKATAIPGRMEIVAQNPFKVIVDYAHTPEQLENVYKTLSANKLICVLGSCGGGRDKWKRQYLGKLAEKYCDKTIITNEDPYDEDPEEIINQVVGDTKAEKISDREEAIKKAINYAEKGSIVVITGKGAEPWLCVKNGKKIPWDDRKIARQEIEKISR